MTSVKKLDEFDSEKSAVTYTESGGYIYTDKETGFRKQITHAEACDIANRELKESGA